MAFWSFLGHIAAAFVVFQAYTILRSEASPSPIYKLVFIPFLAIWTIKPVLFKVTKNNYDTPLVIFNPTAEETEGPFVADIVAVHGLASNPDTAWEAWNVPGSRKPVWLKDFLPNEGLNCRIMAFNHNTAWASDATTKGLGDHAWDLLKELEKVRKSERERTRPIIFIGHSAGGLIIKAALIIARQWQEKFLSWADLCKQTQGIIFLGTPHRGSHPWLINLARLKSLFFYFEGSNTLLLDSVVAGSFHAEELHSSFMAFLDEQCGTSNVISVFETMGERFLGFLPIKVVERSSAVIDGSPAYGFDKTHCQLHRFPSRGDKYYGDLLSWLTVWIKKIKNGTEHGMTMSHIQKESLQSLGFQEMDMRCLDIKKEASNTCTWLLKNKAYQEWQDIPQGLLWIRGKPGAGKSTLVKFALQDCSRREWPEKLVILSFFFHGRGSPLQRTTLGLFRSLIHQLCRQIPKVLVEMTSLYQSKADAIGKFGKDWQWHEAELRALLEQFLKKASENSWSIRIYVDALDEAGEDTAVELISFFQRMIFNSPSEGSRIKICFSCRHYPIIALENGLTILVEDENGRDIESYVQEELEIAKLSPDKLFELKTKIVQRASGVFQWVVLVTQMAIKDCRQGRNVKKALESIRCMPKELHKLYELILHQISKESVAESLHILQWMCFAERPLAITELRVAWVVDAKSPYSCIRDCTSSAEYAEDDDEMEKRLKTLSGGLAEVKRHGNFRIAQLIHQSVNDYLVPGGLESLSQNCSYDLGTSVIGAAQFRLSRSCINYLKMTEIQSWKQTKGREIGRWQMDSVELQSCFPFLRYAAVYWPFHAQKAEKEGVGQQDLLGLLHWPSSHFVEQWHRLSEVATRLPSDDPTRDTEWYTSLFHVAAKYNLKSALMTMLSCPDETKIDTPDARMWTALCYASEAGGLEIVKLLVDHGANVNWATKYDGSPLMIATKHSHIPIMKLLLENGASLYHVSLLKDTIFGTAIARATIEAINLLLEAGADFEFKTGFAQISPLSVAAEHGRKDAVNLLLSKGAELESADFRNLTPLCWAADCGHEDILEIFLQKGADPNVQIKGCFSPLLLAAGSGHYGVVKRLIEIGVDINRITELAHTALHVAAAEGKSDVIKLLLQHGADASKVNLVDEHGERVELDATYMDQEQILHLLIEHGKHLSLPDI